jgi:Domain of unknown function (DUF4920)
MRNLALALAATAVAALAGEATKLGRPFILSQPQPVREVLANPDALVGKAVQVKGKVTEVCQMAGCWMALADLETTKVLRVKVNDGDIVFPKEAVGKVAIAEGTLTKLSLTREQAVAMAKHEAEEQGRKFNPASVKSGGVIYHLKGAGAIIE